jgi:hypothetical protein
MKMKGTVYDLYSGAVLINKVTDAIVTSEKIAIDWVQSDDGQECGLTTTSTDSGLTWKGTWTYPESQPPCTVELTQYVAKNGSIILSGPWTRDDGHIGEFVIYLSPLS